MITFTACICTRNRPNDLRRCLHSLSLSGPDGPEQVLVSDDSTDGPDADAARAVAGEWAGVTYQAGPRKGLGPNRNACLAAAHGTHLCFFDDDVVVPPAFWPAARQAARAHPHRVVTGRELNHNQQPPYTVTPHNIDFWGLQRVPPGDGPLRAVVINACVWPAALFAEAGGFDALLRYGAEEVDMAQRAASSGFPIVYDDALWAEHFPSPAARENYGVLAHAARLYATARAYREYEHRPVKAALYDLLAPLQLLGSAAKSGRPAAVRSALQSIGMAWGYARARRRLGRGQA